MIEDKRNSSELERVTAPSNHKEAPSNTETKNIRSNECMKTKNNEELGMTNDNHIVPRIKSLMYTAYNKIIPIITITSCMLITSLSIVMSYATDIYQKYIPLELKLAYKRVCESCSKNKNERRTKTSTKHKSWKNWRREIKKLAIRYSPLHYIPINQKSKWKAKELLNSKYLQDLPIYKDNKNSKTNVKVTYDQTKAKANIRKLSWQKKKKLKAISRITKLIATVRKIIAPTTKYNSKDLATIKLAGGRPTIEVSAGVENLTLLVDSGSQVNILSDRTLRRLELKQKFQRIKNPYRLKDQSQNFIQTGEAVLVPIRLENNNNSHIEIPFIIQTNATESADLLGTQFLDSLKVTLTFTGTNVKLRTKNNQEIHDLDEEKDNRYDVYVREDTELKIGQNLVEVTLKDPIFDRAITTAMDNTEGMFVKLTENGIPDKIETPSVAECECAICQNQRDVFPDRSKVQKEKCKNNPPIITDATPEEGLVKIKDYAFKIPVLKNPTVGSSLLRKGDRCGIFQPIGTHGEKTLTVQKVKCTRGYPATSINTEKCLVFPGGNLSNEEPNVNTLQKQIFKIAFYYQNEEVTRCAFCRVECRCPKPTQEYRKSKNRIFVNNKDKELLIFINGSEPINKICERLIKVLEEMKADTLVFRGKLTNNDAPILLHNIMKCLMFQQKFRINFFCPNIDGVTDPPTKNPQANGTAESTIKDIKNTEINNLFCPNIDGITDPPTKNPQANGTAESTNGVKSTEVNGNEETCINEINEPQDQTHGYHQMEVDEKTSLLEDTVDVTKGNAETTEDKTPQLGASMKPHKHWLHGYEGAPSVVVEEEDCVKIPPNIEEEEIEKYVQRARPEFQEFLREFYQTEREAFARKSNELGDIHKKEFEYKIDLKGSIENLKRQHPYRVPMHVRLCCDKLIDHWYSLGLVKDSEEKRFASRLVIVKKKLTERDLKKISENVSKNAGKTINLKDTKEPYLLDPTLLSADDIAKMYRICADLRAVNSETQAYYNLCLPSQSVLDDIGSIQSSDNAAIPKSEQRRIYSLLDISQAYNSVRISEDSQYLLTTVSPSLRQFQWTRCPYGIRYISSHFQTIMLKVLYKPLISRARLLIYADDLLVTSPSVEEHKKDLKLLTKALAENGIKVSMRKSFFFVDEFEFLAFSVSPSGVKISKDKVKAAQDYETPKDITGIQRFLGFIQYLSRFIPNFAEKTAILSDKTRKGVPFKWGEEEDKAFNEIKRIIAEEVTLSFCDFSKQLHIYADASRIGGGAILFQEDDDGQEIPVLYHARKWNKLQSTLYSSLELELLILLDILTKLTFFTRHTSHPIVVHSDAKSIVYLMNAHFSSDNTRLERFSAKLLSFDLNFKVEYTKPNDPKIRMVDSLSRQFIHNSNKIRNRNYRKIEKEDIKHNFKEGETLKMDDIMDYVKENPLQINEVSIADLDESLTKEEKELSVKETCKHPIANVRQIFSMFEYLNIERIMKEQSTDEKLRPIINKLMKLENHQDGRYKLYNSVLTKRKDLTLPFSETNAIIVAPRALWGSILAFFHIMGGHCGHRRLYKLINTYYHIQGGLEKCKIFCKSCYACQLCQPEKRRREEVTGPERGKFPGDVYAIDHLKMYKYGQYEYILLIVDEFSGYMACFPSKNMKHTSVIEALKTCFATMGVPRRMKSDQAKQLLNNEKVRELLGSYGVKEIMVSIPYEENHNAKCERTVGLFRHIFRTLSTQLRLKNWVSITHLACICHNVTPKLSHSFSPFEIFHGRRPNIFIPTLPKILDIEKREELYNENKNLINQIKETIVKADAKDRERYLRKRNIKAKQNKDIEVGAMILLKDLRSRKEGEIAKKHGPIYLKDPYIVVHKEKNLAILRKIKDGTLQWAATYHCKPVHSRKELFQSLPVEIQEQLGGEFDKDEILRTSGDFQRLAKQFYRKIKTPPTEFEEIDEAENRVQYLPMERNEGESVGNMSEDNNETIVFTENQDHNNKINQNDQNQNKTDETKSNTPSECDRSQSLATTTTFTRKTYSQIKSKKYNLRIKPQKKPIPEERKTMEKIKRLISPKDILRRITKTKENKQEKEIIPNRPTLKVYNQGEYEIKDISKKKRK